MTSRSGRLRSPRERVQTSVTIPDPASPPPDSFDVLNDTADAAEEDADDDMDAADMDLEQFKEFYSLQEDNAPAIHEKVAQIVNGGLLKPMLLNKEFSEILKKYVAAANTPNLKVPKTNNEVWASMKSFQRSRDITFQKLQQLTVKTLILSAQILSDAVTCTGSKSTMNVHEVRKKAIDLCKIQMFSFQELNRKRIQNIRPCLGEQFRGKGRGPQENMDTLFGNNLGEEIKTINDAMRMTKTLKKEQPKNYPATSPPSQTRRGYPPFKRGGFSSRRARTPGSPGYRRGGLSRTDRPTGSETPLTSRSPLSRVYQESSDQ